jgi:hypothetical protein
MKETYMETGVLLIDAEPHGDLATALGLEGGMSYSLKRRTKHGTGK